MEPKAFSESQSYMRKLKTNELLYLFPQSFQDKKEGKHGYVYVVVWIAVESNETLRALGQINF